MKISFKLMPMPDWMPSRDRYCRGCTELKRASCVVHAVGTNYFYPSCPTEPCQEVVKKQITTALRGSRKMNKRGSFRHWLAVRWRCLEAYLAHLDREDDKLKKADPALWARIKGD